MTYAGFENTPNAIIFINWTEIVYNDSYVDSSRHIKIQRDRRQSASLGCGYKRQGELLNRQDRGLSFWRVGPLSFRQYLLWLDRFVTITIACTADVTVGVNNWSQGYFVVLYISRCHSTGAGVYIKWYVRHYMSHEVYENDTELLTQPDKAARRLDLLNSDT